MYLSLLTGPLPVLCRFVQSLYSGFCLPELPQQSPTLLGAGPCWFPLGAVSAGWVCGGFLADFSIPWLVAPSADLRLQVHMVLSLRARLSPDSPFLSNTTDPTLLTLY